MKRWTVILTSLSLGILMTLLITPLTANAQKAWTPTDNVTQLTTAEPITFELAAAWMGSEENLDGARLSARAIYEVNGMFYVAPGGSFGWLENHADLGTVNTFTAGLTAGVDPGRDNFIGLDFGASLNIFGAADKENVTHAGPALGITAGVRIGDLDKLHVKLFGESTYVLRSDPMAIHHAGAGVGFPF